MSKAMKTPNSLLVSFLLMLIPAALSQAAEATDALARRSQLSAQIAVFESQLAELESEYDLYHPALREPLASMILLLRENGEYQQLAALQIRQLQLVRANLGLQSQELIPLLEEMLSTDIHLGNWEEVSERLGYIRFLYSVQSKPNIEDRLRIMDRQAQWHLSRVMLEPQSSAVSSFFTARQVYEDLELLAKEHYAENEAELIPWLYKRAYNLFQLVKLLNSSGRLGSDAIDRAIREDGISRLQSRVGNAVNSGPFFGAGRNLPVIEKGSIIGEGYLREGLTLINRIEDIIKDQGNAEAAAMALIYHGDFQLLMNSGLAFRSYRNARNQLLEAGIPKERVELFFNRPTVIPSGEFFAELEDAITDKDSKYIGLELSGSTEINQHVGVFQAWTEELSSSARPRISYSLFNIEFQEQQAELEFSISRRGVTSSVDVISSIPDERSVKREARRALRDIQFRPAIFEGDAKRSRNVKIRYLYVPATE